MHIIWIILALSLHKHVENECMVKICHWYMNVALVKENNVIDLDYLFSFGFSI